LITPQWCHTTNDATPVARRRATGRGVAGARVVWVHAAEVRLLPSGLVMELRLMGMSDRSKPGRQQVRVLRVPRRVMRSGGLLHPDGVCSSERAAESCRAQVLTCSRGRGVAATCLASNQVSWVRSPPSARAAMRMRRVTSTVNRQALGSSPSRASGR
jgi:hypothetical protein